MVLSLVMHSYKMYLLYLNGEHMSIVTVTTIKQIIDQCNKQQHLLILKLS